ncbi:MAG: ATP-dependent zinc metalloprotease FtsH [Planctomycetes bacterium]|nr:ATP-dependent zinc metalloprotease FtsH [Planctomycetota bacterium]
MEDSKDPPKKSPEKKTTPQGNNLVWYVLGLMVLLLLLGTVWGGNERLTLKWSDLEELIAVSNPESKTPGNNFITVEDTSTKTPKWWKINGPTDIKIGAFEVVGKLTREEVRPEAIAEDGSITAESQPLGKPEKVTFSVNRDHNEESLDDLLKANGIPYTMAGQPSPLLGYLMPLMFFGMLLLLMVVMMRRMGGAGSPMAFGRSRGKLYAQEDIGVTFDDVAGVDEAVDELREVVDFLQTPDRYQRLGGRIPKGVLLVGPPGTGKTLLAKAVAGEAEVPFFSLSGSDFVEMFVGVGAARVRDMFQQAEQRAPCIIFIDELDALGKTRGSGQIGGHDEREQTLNALLVEMDGFGSNSGVIVMAATNRPETLDAALMRPGRFDRHVLVDRPDVAGREKILDVHLKKIRMAEDVVVKNVAAITSGFVGADLANIVNEAALLAARNGKKAVGMEEFDEAVERSAVGLEKKSRIMHEDEKLRLAYHEGGHALMAYALPNTDPVHKVSIIPRGLSALGYVLQRPEHDRFMWTREQLEAQIQVALAGTMAEELIYDHDIGSGATSDLEKATEIARSMVMDYGMSSLGRVKYRESARGQFLGGDFGSAQPHSEQTAREIDMEVKKIIDKALEQVRHVISERRDALEAIAKTLIEQETLDGEEFKQLMEENSQGARIVPGTDVEPKRAEEPEENNDSGSASAGG